ncbi:hypothetical protein C3486_04815 [Streptomyces sp. Ru73]|uniref:hypothetical protein n=1 Tax=Streptomyces sp. Ru73 TaxID=2080748 RepID=UPI000CDD77C9|nr:hypothetical protein [Streptomyces sp. Ru73]POX42600.1 hypothetical protein C3486_04815 [Streptomyces sp. Ru73]
MRRYLAIVITAAILSGTLGIASAETASAASRHYRTPQCVKVVKYYTKKHKRYVRLTNLCTKRTACYTIVVPWRPDPHGRLKKGATKNVRYGTDRDPRALYVKNRGC